MGGEKSHHLFSSQRKFHQTENNFIKNGSSKSSPIFIDNKSYQNEKMEYNSNMVHCTSPVGSMDGSVLVESESGEFMDFTTLQVILLLFLFYNSKTSVWVCDINRYKKEKIMILQTRLRKIDIQFFH